MTVRVALWGAEGRMGRTLDQVANEEVEGISIVVRVDRALPAPESTASLVDVVIDFSTPSSTRDALVWAEACGAAFVCGTTGIDAATERALDEASTRIPVLHAPNMSLGVAVTRALVRQAAAALPDSFHPEITEVHHARKIDAPSGTALALASEIASARPTVRPLYGRAGETGPRSGDELGVHALRGGDVVGDHTVFFFGAGERVEITHRATDRRIFARGAMTAARWLAGRPAGRYSVEDVLGL